MKQIAFLLLVISGPCALALPTIEFTVWQETCGNANGAVTAFVSGGSPPYTYLWTPAPPIGQGNAGIYGLSAGSYSLTVIDALAQEVTESVDVPNSPTLVAPFTIGVSQGGNFGCNGCGALFSLAHYNEPNIQWPNVAWPLVTSPAPLVDNSAPPNYQYQFGTYCANDEPQLFITDATGCSGTITFGPIMANDTPGPLTVLDMTGACGGPNGSVTIDLGSNGMIFPFDGQVRDAQSNVVGSCSFCFENTFTGLASGDYEVWRFHPEYLAGCPLETLAFTIPDLTGNCGNLSGTLYIDANTDCVQDVSDIPIPYHVLVVEPGPVHMITNEEGQFTTNLLYGNYTLDQQILIGLGQLCPVAEPVPFTLSGGTPNVVIDIADEGTTPLDLDVDLGVGPARPGFVQHYHGTVRNLSAFIGGAVDVTFTFDPAITFLSASPTPTSVVGTTVTWSALPALGPFQQVNVHVHCQVPPDPLLIGTVLNAEFQASQPSTETTLGNNMASTTTTVTGSYDPNDKTATTTSGIEGVYLLDADDRLDYTIRFQNTGTDTAFTVVITDTLSPVLDMATFQIGAASYPYTVSFKPDRVVEWRFANILLPDSNMNEAASHGMVRFSVLPSLPLLPGTVIANTANIFFDFNEPVITDPSVLTAEFSTGVSQRSETSFQVVPNPVAERLTVLGLEASDRITHWSVIAFDGRLVLAGGAPSEGRSLDLGSLASGSYFLTVALTSGRSLTERFVKQ